VAEGRHQQALAGADAVHPTEHLGDLARGDDDVLRQLEGVGLAQRRRAKATRLPEALAIGVVARHDHIPRTFLLADGAAA